MRLCVCYLRVSLSVFVPHPALLQMANLEARLLEVQSQFQQRLSGYSGKVMGLEGELTSIRASTTEQSQDYQVQSPYLYTESLTNTD